MSLCCEHFPPTRVKVYLLTRMRIVYVQQGLRVYAIQCFPVLPVLPVIPVRALGS